MCHTARVIVAESNQHGQSKYNRSQSNHRRLTGSSARPVFWRIVLLLFVGIGLASLVGARFPAKTSAVVPTPANVIGFEPGEDRRLAGWDQVVQYFRKLDASSNRIIVEELGRSTLGRPFIAATISSAENLQRLDRFRQIQRRLADPRLISNETEVDQLVAEGRTIVLITFGIHSTEVGSTLASLNLAYRLVSEDSPDIREILNGCIILLVPSLNPDGVDIVKQWYERTLDTPYEGTSPPQLYHHYVGHDNNRDWYAFTQIETQLTVDKLHNVWHPQIVHDVHQMGTNGARMFVPPYLDPIEPNVDPLIVQGVNFLGTSVAWELTAQGLPGVVFNAIFDAWAPARAYSHYHGGLRILSETASARLATPITIASEQLRPGRNYDPQRPSWNFPMPWPGGQWRLRDITRYMQAGAMAVLRNAARYRQHWLRHFYMIGKRAVETRHDKPFAFVIQPETPTNSVGRAWMINTLLRGGVEIWQAREPSVNGPRYPPGSLFVFLNQPYSAFAKALLEPQRYPDLRQYPGGPPLPPYDVTAHTLPLLMGVAVTTVGERINGDFIEVRQPLQVNYRALVPAKTARLAIYQSYTASMDEGWTRWVLDRFQIPYTVLHDGEMRRGNLRARCDVIIMPDSSVDAIVRGMPEGRYPPEYVGGLSAAGVDALKQFVHTGGRLVALNRASDFAIEYLGLPVRNVLRGLTSSQFYCPGSILGMQVETTHPLARGMPAQSIAWFEHGGAFEVAPERKADVQIVARYGAGNPLLSGWILGHEYLANKAAVVQINVGRGHVVLFGFRPQYRGHSVATFPLLFNALAE